MKKLKLFILSAFLVVGAAVPLIAASSASAITVFDKACTGTNANSAICKGQNENANAIVDPIISTILFLLGAVSVIVIIIGGILYTTSTGDPGKTKRAKDTIMYAVIGLIVALLAYSIVTFVVGRF